MSAVPRGDRSRPLSELEGSVLGCLWKEGPSTAYAVRRVFLASPSSHWSGSAGAVYPALRRLEARGLVRSTHAPHGRRDAWTHELTEAGRARFLEWLEPPFAADVTGLPPDPLRTRLSFLSVLSTGRRRRFLAQAVAALGRELGALAAWSDADPDEQAVQEAAVQIMAARLELFRRLADAAPDGDRAAARGEGPGR